MTASDNVTNTMRTPESVSEVTILLVDDSKTIRRSASGYLSSAGYNVVTAVDGFDACALIKNNADYRDTPVVMLSSKDGLFDKARARVVGSDAHLSKPFSSHALLAAVERHLSENKTGVPNDQSRAESTEVSDG